MRLSHFLFLVWAGIAAPSFLWAQSDSLPEDFKAVRLLRQGKTYLEIKQYEVADHFFQKVIARPFSQSTTAAQYLSAVAAFRMERVPVARQRFRQLTSRYPRSRYVPEARYHLALLDLRSPALTDQQQGLEWLQRLQSRSRDAALRADAQQSARAFLYVTADEALWQGPWAEQAESPLQEWLLEGRMYRQLQQGDKQQAQRTYDRYLETGAAPYPPAVSLLMGRPAGNPKRDSIIRLAMIMPVHAHLAHDSLTEIPRQSQLALELYEGFALGIAHAQTGMNRKVFLQVLDSRRDSIMATRALRELKQRPPHVIVGDIYNPQSHLVAEWAERYQIPQIVPLSPSASLVKDRQQVFLAHGTAADHGHSLATHAWEQRRLSRIVVFTDQRKGTEMLAQSFSQTFDTLGGEIIRLTVDSVYNDSTQEEIRNLVNSLRRQSFDGVYVPILNNEETSGLIISQLAVLGVKTALLGSPHTWQRYSNIDRSLKEMYGLTLTTAFICEKQSPDYQKFYDDYLQTYACSPSAQAIQGYDLGRYLSQVLDNYLNGSRLHLAEFIRRYPYFQGLHQGFEFAGQQSNQFVNLVAYQDGTIKPINRPEVRPTEDLFDTEVPFVAEPLPRATPQADASQATPAADETAPRVQPRSADIEEAPRPTKSRLRLLGRRKKRVE